MKINTRHIQHHLYSSHTLIFYIIFAFTFGCSEGTDSDPLRSITSNRQILTPSQRDSVGVLGNVSDISFKDRQIFLLDSQRRNIIVLRDSLSSLVVGGIGRGPGKLDIPIAMDIDNYGDVHVFDMNGYRMQIFSPTGYRLTHSLKISEGLIDFSVTDTLYYTFDTGNAIYLRKHNLEGDMLGKLEISPKTNYAKFISRLDIGGIDIHGSNVIISNPVRGSIIIIEDMEVKRTVNIEKKTGINVKSSYPAGLSPFSFTDKHSDWWNSFYHVDKVYISNNNKAVIEIFDSKDLKTDNKYILFYDLEINQFLRFIRIPENEKVLDFYGGKLYTIKIDDLYKIISRDVDV